MSESTAHLAFAELEMAEANHAIYMAREAARRIRLSGQDSGECKANLLRALDRLQCAVSSLGYVDSTTGAES